MNPSRTSQSWTDVYLDALRQQGDTLADTCVARLHQDHTSVEASALFQDLQTNDSVLSADAPPALQQFFEATRTLPDHTDQDRIKHGEEIFMTHALPASLVLLTKSLPSVTPRPA